LKRIGIIFLGLTQRFRAGLITFPASKVHAIPIPRRSVAALMLTFAIALTLPFVSAQESKPTIRHHRVEEPAEDVTPPEVAQAEDAIQHNDFATAEALLQKAIAAKPNDYRAWFDLGYVYNATHRQTEAIDAYRKAVAAKPDVFESNLNLGLLLAKSGDNAEAAKYLRAATQLKPTPGASLARAWQALGRVLESTAPQQALAAYAEATKLNPKDPEPHIAAAVLLTNQKDFEAAAREYQTAVQLDPTSKDALSGLVDLYVAQKKYSDAEAALRKLLASDPQNNAAHLQLGRVLLAEGKNSEAADEFHTALQANPNDPHAALELGTLYVKANKNPEAEQQFRVAVHGSPQDPEPHYALGSLLMYEKKFPEAQQELLMAVRLKPDLADAYGNLAIVAAANKDYTLALQSLDMRAKFLPETPATYFLRATTFDNLKAIPQAVEYYQKFLAVDGGKFPDQEWQARHRLIAIDPRHADKYEVKK
ncbi:MAG: tetratricopeptide repeat protein, partial [Candidatus Korobacteraceae bacterium]